MSAMNDPVDPRMIRSRKAILSAARTLLLREGPGALSHQRVAQQAGVGRATVYRHWPRLDLLVVDAMASVELPFFREPTCPVRPWLRGQMRTYADELVLPQVAAVAVRMLLNGAGEPHRAVQNVMVATVTTRLEAALALAASAGELDLVVAVDDAFALLVGPLLHRVVVQGGPVRDVVIERAVESVGTWHEK
jgi:AcrR family transcriptional regulator